MDRPYCPTRIGRPLCWRRLVTRPLHLRLTLGAGGHTQYSLVYTGEVVTLSPNWRPDTLAGMSYKRMAVIFSCVIFAGCASLSPSGSAPIASWSGKHSIDDAVDCVKRALDYNFRSVRPLIYHVRVKSNGSETTTVELFMPGTMYSEPVRDSLAKCP
jgi:hypothetical protein